MSTSISAFCPAACEPRVIAGQFVDLLRDADFDYFLEGNIRGPEGRVDIVRGRFIAISENGAWMGMEVSWHSQAGCRPTTTAIMAGSGYVAMKHVYHRGRLLDGPDGGALTQAIIRELEDGYVVSDQAMTPEALLAQLPRLHENLYGFYVWKDLDHDYWKRDQ